MGPSESSHLYLKVGGRDSYLGMARVFSSPKARPQGHPFTNKSSLSSPSQTVPPAGDQQSNICTFGTSPPTTTSSRSLRLQVFFPYLGSLLLPTYKRK